MVGEDVELGKAGTDAVAEGQSAAEHDTLPLLGDDDEAVEADAETGFEEGDETRTLVFH